MKAESSVKSRQKGARPVPLAQQILDNGVVKPKKRQPKEKHSSVDENLEFLDSRLSNRIIKQAAEQQEEINRELGDSHEKQTTGSLPSLVHFPEADKEVGSDLEDESLVETEEKWIDFAEIDKADEEALAQFMAKEPARRYRLADRAMDMIKERETEIESQLSEQTVDGGPMDPKVVAVYKSVGQLLSKYRSGRLPKAFKIIPSLTNWEEVLELTNPDDWSAAAMYQASRLFVSNLNAKAAQRFFNLVLLPRLRDDIAEYKRLNVHLYNALKKALFRPQVFFKAILLPLAEAGDCTLREAIILGSVMAKVSIPVLHSSAAMLRLAEMDYTGPISIFLRVLIDKKYALPYRVVDALVHHFVRTMSDHRQYPVLWHQCLLAFAQRYKQEITSEQKDALLQVLRVHSHPLITPEVRAELMAAATRDVVMDAPDPDIVMESASGL